ncbi:MAG: hypothetical protein R2860_05135 [Desulfobacterales bacterium]
MLAATVGLNSGGVVAFILMVHILLYTLLMLLPAVVLICTF